MRTLDMIKRMPRGVIRLTQKVLIALLLFAVYIVFFGITRLLAEVFRRSALKEKTGEEETFWDRPSGYGSALEDCLRQS